MKTNLIIISFCMGLISMEVTNNHLNSWKNKQVLDGLKLVFYKRIQKYYHNNTTNKGLDNFTCWIISLTINVISLIFFVDPSKEKWKDNCNSPDDIVRQRDNNPLSANDQPRFEKWLLLDNKLFIFEILVLWLIKHIWSQFLSGISCLLLIVIIHVHF